MSITRAQIARQLLAQGGSPGNTTRQRVLPRADGKRPGYYGSDAGFGSDDYKDESASFDSGSGSGGSDQDFANARAAMNARTVSPTRDEAIQNPFGITRVNRNFISPKAAVNRRPPPTEFIEEEETPIGVRTGDVFPGLDKVTARDVFKVSADNPMLHRSVADQIAISMVPGIGKAINLGERFAYDLPAFRFSRTGGKGPTIPTGGGDNMPMPMMPFRSPELPSDIESRPSDFDLYAALEGREAMNFGMNPNNMMGAMQRFSDGGEVRQAYGLGSFVKKFKRGVKKVGRGIKKFAKSDLGKVALLYAVGTGLGSFTKSAAAAGTSSGFSRFNPKNLAYLTGYQGQDYTDQLAETASNKMKAAADVFNKSIPEKANEMERFTLNQDFLKNYAKETAGTVAKKTGKIPNLVKFGIPAAMGASYLFAKNEQPDDLDAEMMKNYKDTSGLKELYAQFPEYRFQVPEQYRLADGGRIGYDMGGDVEMASYGYDDAMNETRELFMQYKKSGIVPMEMEFEEFLELLQGSKQKEEPNRVMAQEGGIMNLGGLEKDYREGGFVPIGEYEKKDDVPARLSKNEFVFTADAVRAAGGGSVDKGADLMYKTMKNLESRVG